MQDELKEIIWRTVSFIFLQEIHASFNYHVCPPGIKVYLRLDGCYFQHRT